MVSSPWWSMLPGVDLISDVAYFANANPTDPTNWAHYGVAGPSDNGSKTNAVLNAAAKSLGISSSDPTFQQAAQQANAASLVGYGGPSPDQIISKLTTDYNNLKANPASTQQGQEAAPGLAIAPAQANLTDAQKKISDLYGTTSSQTNPYEVGSAGYNKALDSAQQQLTGQQQASQQAYLNSLGGMSQSGGNAAIRSAAVAGANATALGNLQNQYANTAYQLAPGWQQQQTSNLSGLIGSEAGIAGQQANVALGGVGSNQQSYQFGVSNSNTQVANTNSNNAAVGGLIGKGLFTGAAAASIPLTGGATTPYVLPAVGAVWGSK